MVTATAPIGTHRHERGRYCRRPGRARQNNGPGATRRVRHHSPPVYSAAGDTRHLGTADLLKRTTIADHFESIPRRELYFFALYRTLEASLLAALLFSPVLGGMLGAPRNGQLAMVVVSVYLLASLGIMLWGRNVERLVPLVVTAVSLDILVAGMVTWLLPDAYAGVAMLLLFNVAAAALLLPVRYGLFLAGATVAVLAFEFFYSSFVTGGSHRSLAELIMFASSYLAVAYLAGQMGQRTRHTQALAERRGAEVANLVEINELIIRRMRTGVLVVDAEGQVTLANEAATLLVGDTEGGHAQLARVAPELSRRLKAWRNGWQNDESPMQVSPDQPEVQPRFAALLADSDLTLVFLDDATVVSRRAESLTLAALGRFSASLAHEIRNPLAAINYASQLLEESKSIGAADRRLLEIIHQQCQRTNGIIESVLGLARRERASPEHIDLGNFVRRFVDDYRQSLSIETDSLEIVPSTQIVHALVDPRHLQQVLTILVHNALKYGRLPDEPARVRIRIALSNNRMAAVDVMDRGPGIPEGVVAQLFRPFYTTSEHGTGLGLYIARELCRANQAQLEYVAVPGGGACFRITLPGPHGMLPA